MKLSLVITAFDRCDDLRRFFSSIGDAIRFSPCNIQIIFVNQGFFEPLDEFEFLSQIEFLQIHTEKLPLSSARNLGLKYVSGDIIGFPDDDCWYPPTAIESIIRYFHYNPQISAICTNVYDPLLKKSYGNRPVNSSTNISFYNLFQLPISVGIFIRKDAFISAGLYFDSSLGAGTKLGSGEETDLIYRLLKLKLYIEYIGSIQIFHPVPLYESADIEKYYRYGLGFGFLNGRILHNREFRVIPHFLNVLFRSLGGFFVHLFSSTERNLYLRRFLGICRGFILGFKDGKC